MLPLVQEKKLATTTVEVMGASVGRFLVGELPVSSLDYVVVASISKPSSARLNPQV